MKDDHCLHVYCMKHVVHQGLTSGWNKVSQNGRPEMQGLL